MLHDVVDRLVLQEYDEIDVKQTILQTAMHSHTQSLTAENQPVLADK